MKIIASALLLIAFALTCARAEYAPEAVSGIPEEYFKPSDAPGRVEEFYYETWEAFSYGDRLIPLTKRAIVYLPYGYDAARAYGTVYLIHGMCNDETCLLGIPGDEKAFKNVLDNAIQCGVLEPLIVVCPTYNNLNSAGRDSDDFELGLRLSRLFYNEFFTDLLPAVEGAYSAYASDVTPNGLKAARENRMLGGFSLGAVTVWRLFEHGALDYFRLFVPMSCGIFLDDAYIHRQARAYDPDSYFILIMNGIYDSALQYDNERVRLMRREEWFSEASAATPGNFAYLTGDEYGHGDMAFMQYAYNALCFFAGTKPAADATK